MNRLAAETSPYLRQHADNPVDWYPWGDEAFARATEDRQADLPLHRLLGLPLVPCHGPRVVRGRGHGGRPQRRIRLDQGRPGGAARRRRRLHGGGPGHDRLGGLAHDRVPHARRPPLLRRDLLPTPRPPRLALVHDGPQRPRRCLDRSARRGRAPGGRAVPGRGRAISDQDGRPGPVRTATTVPWPAGTPNSSMPP